MNTLARLGDVTECVMGQAPPSKECNKNGIGIPFVKAGEFSVYRPIIREWTTMPLKLARKSDVLLCVVGATCGKINLGEDCAIGRSVAAIRPIEKLIDQMYLYYFLQSWTYKLRAVSQGAAQTVITKEMITELKLSLPPFHEQKRIAAILDKADAIRRKRQQTIDLADQFLRSVFLDVFGAPLLNKKDWDIMDINSICTKVTDGTHDTPKREESGIPYITGKHIKPFRIDFDNCDFVSDEVHREIYRRCNPENGDVLYTNIGVNLGTAASNTANFEFSMKNVSLLKPKKELILSDFLTYVLNEQKMKDEIRRIASLGGAQGFLSLKDIKALKIIVPPIAQQKQFVDLVKRVGYSNLTRSKFKNCSEELFKALSQLAFKGALTQSKAA